MIFVLNKDLNRVHYKLDTLSRFVDRFRDIKHDYKNRVSKSKLKAISHNVTNDFLHTNYLEYLETCWQQHLGANLTPDILWYTLLCQITELVGEHVEECRDIFTTSKEKQEISVPGDSNLPLESIIRELKARVPTNVDLFLPEFKTTDHRSRLAKYAAFADMVSPYYNYSTFCCGIPYLNITGNIDEYKLIQNNWFTVGKLLKVENRYFDEVNDLLTDIIKNFESKDFWSTMVNFTRCGSGSEIEFTGWYSKFYRKQPEYVAKVDNFTTEISNVNYKWLDTQRNFVMKQGLFSSKLVDAFLEPTYNILVFEKLEEDEIIPY